MSIIFEITTEEIEVYYGKELPEKTMRIIAQKIKRELSASAEEIIGEAISEIKQGKGRSL